MDVEGYFFSVKPSTMRLTRWLLDNTSLLMIGNESVLPFGDAFSLAQLETERGGDYTKLAAVPDLIGEHEREEVEFMSIAAERFFEGSRNPEERARLVILRPKNQGYQLVKDDFRFTDLGKDLYKLRDYEGQLYREFAGHILLNLHGWQVIGIIRDYQSDGQDTTTDETKDALGRYYDIRIRETSNHWSQMRGWLAEAEILNTGSPYYEINTGGLNERLRLSTEELDALEGLIDEQRALLRAFAIIDLHCSASRSEVTPTQIASVTTTARLTNATTTFYVARSGFREDATKMTAQVMQNEPYTILTLSEQPDPVYNENSAALSEALESQLHSIRRTKEDPATDRSMVVRSELRRTVKHLKP